MALILINHGLLNALLEINEVARAFYKHIFYKINSVARCQPTAF
jgi:hypothetical protein